MQLPAAAALRVCTFKNCEGLSGVAFMDGNGVVTSGKVISCQRKESCRRRQEEVNNCIANGRHRRQLATHLGQTADAGFPAVAPPAGKASYERGDGGGHALPAGRVSPAGATSTQGRGLLVWLARGTGRLRLRPLGRDIAGQYSAAAFQQEVDEYVTEIVDAKLAQGVIRNR